MKLHKQLVISMAALAFVSAAAFAQTTTVTVPVGDTIKSVGDLISAIAGPLVVVVFGFLARNLPSLIVDAMRTAKVDQLLTKAIQYAINIVEIQTKGATGVIDVHSAIVAKALQYVIDMAPGWLITYMGGIDKIEKKILARVTIEPAK